MCENVKIRKVKVKMNKGILCLATWLYYNIRPYNMYYTPGRYNLHQIQLYKPTLPSMPKIPEGKNPRQARVSTKSTVAVTGDILHHQAFDNSLQASILSITGSGQIILANVAACRLLGYSKKEILTKSRSTIFDIHESSFKKMLKQRTAEGQSIGLVTGIKKNGKLFPCAITSAVFMGNDGVEKAITTITDRSREIRQQKNIDSKKDKIVAGNIELVQAIASAKLKENDEWIKYIAKTSYDVMWDWDIITGNVYVGDSIIEVFGYEVRNDIVRFKDFLRCLVPEERIRVEEKICKALASRNKNWDDSYSLKRRDRSVAVVASRSVIIRDEHGKAIRMIGATQDVSRLQELEKKLTTEIFTHGEDSKRFLLATKLAIDVIWDWNILDGEVFIEDGFGQLFDYSSGDNKTVIAYWKDHLHPEDKEAVEKSLHDAIVSAASHWQHAYRFIRVDGSIAEVFNSASIIRQPGGKATRMIGVMQDTSLRKIPGEKPGTQITVKDKMLAEHDAIFKLAFYSSSDVLYDCDLVANVVTISNGYEKEFGYKVTGNMTAMKDWMNHIHPDDKEAVMKNYTERLASADIEWKYGYRFLRADGSVANVISSGIILRNARGEAYRMVGSMHDISKQKVLEEQLAHEIRLKEQQITDAMEDARDTERSDIGKELHDNVNQLMAASKMYLDMAKRGGENSKMYIDRSSEYTLTAIEEIRKLTKGLTTDIIKNLGLCKAIEDIARDTMETNPVKISCALHLFSEPGIGEKFKLNIFRIVQEQLNNILKHAKATQIAISLCNNKDTVRLIIADNGLGFDTAKKRTGIGIDNIISRVRTFHGSIVFASKPGEGCVLTANFPLTSALPNKV